MEEADEKIKNIDTLLSRLETEIGNKFALSNVSTLPKRSKIRKVSSHKIVKKKVLAKMN